MTPFQRTVSKQEPQVWNPSLYGQPDLADYLWRGKAPYHVVSFSTSDVYFRLAAHPFSGAAEGGREAGEASVSSDVNLY